MEPEIPILMITLQIPVTPDIDVNEVLNAIAERVAQALEEARQQMPEEDSNAIPSDEDPEAVSSTEFKSSVIRETEERFTQATREDLLARLGYTTAA